MPTTRDQAYAALFALVSAPTVWSWAAPPQRRVQLWKTVDVGQRPTLFQYEGGEDSYVWKDAGKVVTRTVNARIFIYTDATDKSLIASTPLNNIVDAVEAVIAPPLGDDGSGLQTLGGLVYQARIAKVDRTPGDLDGDGIAIIDVEIILP
jgi:hypothetical protein